MMRRFASAAIAAVALFAPVLTPVLMDNSVVSVLGAPDENCGSGGSRLRGRRRSARPTGEPTRRLFQHRHH